MIDYIPIFFLLLFNAHQVMSGGKIKERTNKPIISNPYIAKAVDGVSQTTLPGNSGEGIQPIRKN